MGRPVGSPCPTDKLVVGLWLHEALCLRHGGKFSLPLDPIGALLCALAMVHPLAIPGSTAETNKNRKKCSTAVPAGGITGGSGS